VHKTLVVLSLLAPAAALAQLQELENPGTVSAIQERAYRMQHELNLAIGLLPQDAFYKGLTVKGSYGFHFTDSIAAQGYFTYSYNLPTGLRQQLERDFGVLPTAFDEVQFFFGGDLLWKPLYGKLAVMNRSVIHGEVWLLAGAAGFKFTNTFRPGINIGGGGRWFISQYVSLRLDVTNYIVLPVGGGSTSFTNVLSMTLALALNFGGSE
jgi:outer membrane beta-barrel protein